MAETRQFMLTRFLELGKHCPVNEAVFHCRRMVVVHNLLQTAAQHEFGPTLGWPSDRVLSGQKALTV